MALHFSELFSYQKQQTDAGKNASSFDATNNSQVAAEIKSLKAGQTLSGVVVGVKDNEVQIQIQKDLVFTARLDRDMKIALGQMMTFEVKSNTGLQLALRPLFENMAQQATLAKAIELAGLPANGTTLQIVNSLMEQGMPIDKATMQTIYQQTSANMDAEIADIVLLNKWQIPVTENNIEQLQNYNNFKHQLVNGIDTVLQEIPETYSTLQESGQETEAVLFYGKILQLFTESGAESASSMLEMDGNPLVKALVEGQDSPTLLSGTEKGPTIEKSTVFPTTVPLEVIGIKEEQPRIANTLPVMNDPEMLDNLTTKNSVSQQPVVVLIDQETASPILLPKEFINEMEALGVPKEELDKIQNGVVTPKEILTMIAKHMIADDGSYKPEIKPIFENQIYRNLLNQTITSQFLLDPKEVGKPDKIEEYYSNLRSQTMHLASAINDIVKAEVPLTKSLNNIQNNITFLDNLNQMFNYIQLPLKMSEENTHGELYVYTNKKNLASKDGNVSALLHLDMDHLGMIDIFVAMQQNRVTTNFYLEKEELIDFIEENIYMLENNLSQKGYQMDSKINKRDNSLDKKENPVLESLQSKNKPVSTLAQKSFDVRA